MGDFEEKKGNEKLRNLLISFNLSKSKANELSEDADYLYYSIPTSKVKIDQNNDLILENLFQRFIDLEKFILKESNNS